MSRGRKEPLTRLEKIFWERLPDLCVDDPEDELNEVVALLRNTALKYWDNKSSQLEPLVMQAHAPQGVQNGGSGVVCHVICKNPKAHENLIKLCNKWHRFEPNSMFIDWEQSLLSYKKEDS